MSDDTSCVIRGCDRPRSARRLCVAHYKQHRHAGTLDQFPCLAPGEARRRKPESQLARMLDELRAADAVVRPCRRGCCWTPFGHSRAARACTCHTGERVA